jgi:hypothetical protein
VASLKFFMVGWFQNIRFRLNSDSYPWSIR